MGVTTWETRAEHHPPVRGDAPTVRNLDFASLPLINDALQL